MNGELVFGLSVGWIFGAILGGLMVFASVKGTPNVSNLDCDYTQNVMVYDKYPDRFYLDQYQRGHWICVPLDKVQYPWEVTP